MGMQKAGGISGGSLCSVCCLSRGDQRSLPPSLSDGSSYLQRQTETGENQSLPFANSGGEQGLLCVCNISHLFLASSIWWVRSLEPRLKHVLSKCYPDLPKLCAACSNAHPKEAEQMVHGKVVLVLYARVQITMCPHLLQHFFFWRGGEGSYEKHKTHFEHFWSKKHFMKLFPGWCSPCAFSSNSAFRILFTQRRD